MNDLFSQPAEQPFDKGAHWYDAIPLMMGGIHHGKENTPANTAHYEANLDHFNKQCRLVLEALLRGERLTTTDALRYGIGDLRARVRDLLQAGVPVEKEFVTTEDGKTTRFKVYFISTQ